jgi:hypothetical protein
MNRDKKRKEGRERGRKEGRRGEGEREGRKEDRLRKRKVALQPGKRSSTAGEAESTRPGWLIREQLGA